MSVGVAKFSVDKLVAEHGLPQPTHIKIDVDGIESRIVAGMEKTLSSNKLVSIALEVSTKDSFDYCHEILTDRHFSCGYDRFDGRNRMLFYHRET